MRVLIAEDERISRVSLTRQVEAWGHTVVAEEDGQAAWERLSAGEFDLIITDWEMPRLSGLDLVRRIRASQSPNFVYIIMLTGRGATADLVAGIEAGADDFVAKPFQRDELRVRLLAGERIVKLERTLSRQNSELREAQARMRRDLDAAARVQRGMLPSANIETPAVRTSWKYVPTDALAGDSMGFHLIDDRYLVAYVIDVAGHGVPAALLAVMATHALAPEPAATSLLRDHTASGSLGSVQLPERVAAELNRRFRADQSDGRFLTLVLCALDTHRGLLHVGLAGHPPPLILRNDTSIQLGETDGLPIGLLEDGPYAGAAVQLEPGDRVVLFSDGIPEQLDASDRVMFGVPQFEQLARSLAGSPVAQIAEGTVDALVRWSGGRTFNDDVSIVTIEWLGPSVPRES